MKNHNIILGNWYEDVMGIKGINHSKADYKDGSCPIAEKIASQSLNLPNHMGISIKDAGKIVRKHIVFKHLCLFIDYI